MILLNVYAKYTPSVGEVITKEDLKREENQFQSDIHQFILSFICYPHHKSHHRFQAQSQILPIYNISCTCYETVWISLRSTSLTRTHTMFHVALIQNMLILQNMLTVHNVYLLNENQHFYDVCTALLQYILCYSDINTCISIQKEKKIVTFFVVT